MNWWVSKLYSTHLRVNIAPATRSSFTPIHSWIKTMRLEPERTERHSMEMTTHAHIRIYWFFPPKCRNINVVDRDTHHKCGVQQRVHKYSNSGHNDDVRARNMEHTVSVLHIEATAKYPRNTCVIVSDIWIQCKRQRHRKKWCPSPSQPHSISSSILIHHLCVSSYPVAVHLPSDQFRFGRKIVSSSTFIFHLILAECFFVCVKIPKCDGVKPELDSR